MITWSTGGAVERPVIVQIRVQRSYPGRIRAGAPLPTRSMTTDEVLASLRYFTVESRGPRTAPCVGLVLSGVGVASRDDSPLILERAREWGIERVVLHAGGEDLDSFTASRWRGRVDVLVIPMQPAEMGGELASGARAVRECREQGIRVAVNTVLHWRAVECLPAVARSILRVRPDEVTFTYPFPITGADGANPPPIARTLVALREVFRLLEVEGVAVRVKGLPACYLGPDRGFLGRSQNRWYVDADHPKSQALMFFPDVVAFSKEEICRFCAEDGRCDGFFATYLMRPGFPALNPIEGPVP